MSGSSRKATIELQKISLWVSPNEAHSVTASTYFSKPACTTDYQPDETNKVTLGHHGNRRGYNYINGGIPLDLHCVCDVTSSVVVNTQNPST